MLNLEVTQRPDSWYLTFLGFNRFVKLNIAMRGALEKAIGEKNYYLAKCYFFAINFSTLSELSLSF